MMSRPIFLKSESSELYFMPGVFEQTGLKDYYCAYLPPAGKLPPSPLPLSTSWELPGGIYLFLNARPLEEAAFVAAVRQFVARSNRHVRLLWLDDPNLPISKWTPQYMESDESGTETKLTQLRFRNYRLVIGAKAQMRVMESDGGSGIMLKRPFDEERWCYWQGSGSPVYVAEQAIYLPFTGEQLGCISFPLILNQQTGGADDLDALDIGIRYYYDHPDYPGYLQSLRYRIFQAASLRLNGYVDPLHPLIHFRTCFEIAKEAVLDSYFMTWTGSRIRLKPASNHSAKFVFALQPTSLTVTDADPATLVPSGAFELQAQGPGLFEEDDSSSSVVEGREQQSAIQASRPTLRLMLGLSALEYAGCLHPTGNRLHFVPGQPAYAPGFMDESKQGEGLKGNALTSYIYVTSQESGAISYYSQPEKSVLYELGAEASPINPVTEYMELAVRPLQALKRAEQAFPAVPYGYLRGLPNEEHYERFEKHVLTPARKERVLQAVAQLERIEQMEQADEQVERLGTMEHVDEQVERLGTMEHVDEQVEQLETMEHAAKHADQFKQIDQLAYVRDERSMEQLAARIGVTRKGWLARFNVDLTAWQSLVLAQARRGGELLELAGPGGGPIRGPLEEALSSNQLFLVAEGPKFAQHAKLLSSLLTIEGFSFDLNPDNWAASGTILILKYSAGSLKELAAQMDAWTMPATFNEGGLTQLRIQRIFQHAEEMAETHVEFQAFAALLNDPGWTGLLALNVHTPLELLPPELAGLRSGIRAADFKAHHFGIHSSPVLVQEGAFYSGGAVSDLEEKGRSSGSLGIRLKDSSMFGLIYYDEETSMPTGSSVYRYRVKSLKVLFENSAIKSFTSSVELLVNKLFGDAVQLQGITSSPNVILFNGVYQEEGGKKTYVFLNEQELLFQVKSEIVEEVELQRAQFLTETTPEEQQAGQDIESRFSFSGRLRFKYRSDYDLFSFGKGPDGEEGHLSFSQLALSMRFSQSEPDKQQFFFDARNLSIDLGTSQARAGSLFRHFPLNLTGFIQAEAESTPASLGYHSVQTPISEAPLSYPWYGLEFELNLGSLGALASNAGFTAKLLAAWSPSDGGMSMFTGIYIPGTGDSGSMFSLQNILHFSIDSFRMKVGQTAAGHPSYTLILNNLRMNFLGLQLPSSAYVDFVLFGNPDPGAQAESLGWYASYLDESSTNKS